MFLVVLLIQNHRYQTKETKHAVLKDSSVLSSNSWRIGELGRNWSLVNDFLLVLLYSISGYSFVEGMMDGSKVAKYIKTSVSEILLI